MNVMVLKAYLIDTCGGQKLPLTRKMLSPACNISVAATFVTNGDYLPARGVSLFLGTGDFLWWLVGFQPLVVYLATQSLF